MSTKLQVQGILLMLIATAAALLIIIGFYTQDQIRQSTNTVKEERSILINQLADRMGLRISEAITILQIASKNDHMTNPVNASSVNANLHGIPENVDTERRKIMHDIFETDNQFQNLLFVLPNGDVYINEPFVFQKNMTTSNFAFRDWYTGAMSSHSVYVSQVVVSKSSGKPNVVIAVPVSSENGSFLGLLTGSFSLDKFQKEVENSKLYSLERIIVVDNTGAIVADSEGTSTTIRHLTGDDVFQKAIAGENGTVSNMVNGTNIFTAYAPMSVGQTRWAIISIQPYNDAFHAVTETVQESIILSILVVAIVSVAGYFLYRSFRDRVKLASELEKSNIGLQIQSQKLREADTAKEEFATMVTHELKTPLVTINGYSEMLKEKGLLGTLNEEQEDAVNKIYAASKKLENLIGDILVAQKIDLNKLHFNMIDFDAENFMNDIVQTYLVITKDKKISFKNVTTEKFTIKSDKDRLSQVFDNLIRNSIDFVPISGGKIEIGVKHEDNQAIFFVKDNGIGIPKDKQANLFKKFYQIDSSLKRQHGGTGLGLVICKGLVEGLGGRIWFESDVGKGTTFWFSIPTNTAEIQNNKLTK
ncbi:MAG: sensor histidine kinase [Thaumarchaeota archaeon]|nr:sensor histidine kinase [Nitrososphaerota archaeon]